MIKVTAIMKTKNKNKTITNYKKQTKLQALNQDGLKKSELNM